MTDRDWPRPLSEDRAASAMDLLVVDDWVVGASRVRLADFACYSRALNPFGRLWLRFAKHSHPIRAAVGFAS
jgi:hypothetical protein